MTCRICLEEEGTFVQPCKCKGTTGYVHQKCLNRWVEESNKNKCEICNFEYHKKEIYAFNKKRFCKHFFQCNIAHGEQIKKYTFAISILMSVSLIFIDIRELVLASCISSFMCGMGLLVYSFKQYKDAGNAALLWKIAFSVPYTISLLIFFLTNEDNCDYACITVHHSCDKTCPFFAGYQQRSQYLISIWLYDMATLITVFLLRTLLVAIIHCKTITFISIGEENQPLLSLKTEP